MGIDLEFIQPFILPTGMRYRPGDRARLPDGVAREAIALKAAVNDPRIRTASVPGPPSHKMETQAPNKGNYKGGYANQKRKR